MKTIFQEYGPVILAAVIGIALMALFFGITVRGRRGVDRIAGEVMEDQTKDALKDGASSLAYEAFGTAAADSIWFNSANPVYSGRRIRVGDHFLARASDGSALEIRVLGIRDRDGRAVDVRSEGGADYVTFPRPGIYRIYLKAGSESVREREAVISFPVERGA